MKILEEDGDSKVSIFGSGDLQPIISEEHLEKEGYIDARRRDELDRTEEFLREVASHLESQWIIQTISNTKLRYPFGGKVIAVDTDGTITRQSIAPHTVKE